MDAYASWSDEKMRGYLQLRQQVPQLGAGGKLGRPGCTAAQPARLQVVQQSPQGYVCDGCCPLPQHLPAEPRARSLHKYCCC